MVADLPSFGSMDISAPDKALYPTLPSSPRGWPITNTVASLSLMEFLPIKNSLPFLLFPADGSYQFPSLLYYYHRTPTPIRSADGPPPPSNTFQTLPMERHFLRDNSGLRCGTPSHLTEDAKRSIVTDKTSVTEKMLSTIALCKRWRLTKVLNIWNDVIMSPI